MQRTFLHSFSEEILRLHKYNHSQSNRRVRNNDTSELVHNNLIDALLQGQRERKHLLDHNKQLQAALRQKEQELVAKDREALTIKEENTQLLVENRTLKTKLGIKEQGHQPNRIAHVTPLNNKRMLNQPQTAISQTNNVPPVLLPKFNTPIGTKSRKRTAGLSASSMADGESGAGKRSLLHNMCENSSSKTFDAVDVGENSNNKNCENSPKIFAPVEIDFEDEEDHGKQNQEQYFTAPDTDTSFSKRGEKVRRSISMPPPETPVNNKAAKSSTLRTSGVTVHRKPNNGSRLATLKGTRISSSHGDLSRIAWVDEDDNTDSSPPDGGRWLFAEEAVHSFSTKRNFLRICCVRCDCAIRFGVLYVKCQRCKGTFHEACRKHAQLPCVLRKMTPKQAIHGGKFGRLRLGDYCPDIRPMVPPLIAYCTYFLDDGRHHNIVYDDIYRIDGDADEVDTILKMFQSSKCFPKLEPFHPMNVAAGVKKFLSQIREPVIPFSYGKEICGLLNTNAKTNDDSNRNGERFKGIVEDLPVAHMDTLGHLCRHWNRNSQLATDKLSIAVGPIIFGSTRPDSPLPDEAAVQAMSQLLELPAEFWSAVSASPGTSRSNNNTPLSRNPSLRTRTPQLLNI